MVNFPIRTCLFCFIFPIFAPAQNHLTIENIFSRPEFRTPVLRGVDWIPGQEALSFTKRDEKSGVLELWSCSASTGQIRRLTDADKFSLLQPQRFEKRFLLPNYRWAPDGRSIAITADSDLFLYDFEESIRLTDDRLEERDPQFSPDGAYLAYLKNGDIVLFDLSSGEEKAVTSHSDRDILIGRFDWAYEEEFKIRTGFFWSPDSRHILYFQVDQRDVQDFPIIDFIPLTNSVAMQKYPRAGQAISIVHVGVLDIQNGRTVWTDRVAGPDNYIPRADWLPHGQEIALTWINRDQNELELLFSDINSGKTRVVLKESVQNGWLSGTRQPHFLKDNDTFLWLSEADGYNHIYRYDYQGHQVGRLTSGEWDVADIAGIGSRRVFFTACNSRSEGSALFSTTLRDQRADRLTKESGNHSVFMNPSATYFLSTYSRFDVPSRNYLYRSDGRFITEITPDTLRPPVVDGLPRIEFFQVKTKAGDLDAYMIKPVNFDSTKKYPLLIKTYAGPESRSVIDHWLGRITFWYAFLSQHDILISAIDGRGTADRGRAWKHAVYKHLGDVEIEDQIEGARVLASLDYVDSSRVGIWGESYGGYSTIMCLLKGAPVFKMGIAVSPVTDWRNYDAIYSERYMGHPMDNEDGYNEASAINHAKNLQAKLLLIHGSGDDNVHMANTMQLAETLQRHHLDFDLMIYPRHRHNINGTEASVHMYNKITDYILANL